MFRDDSQRGQVPCLLSQRELQRQVADDAVATRLSPAGWCTATAKIDAGVGGLWSR